MSKEKFTQQEIAPEILTQADSNALGSDFAQAVETGKNTNAVITKTGLAWLEHKRVISTSDITHIAMFVAIGLVLNMYSSILPKTVVFGRFSLIYSYCLICGVMLGAVRGGVCAGVADMLVALTLPEGGQVWMPLITISNFLMAFIPGLLFRVFKEKLTLTLVVSSVISFFVCTLGFTALGETLLYSYFGSAPYYPSITALVQTGTPVYLAFVIRKSIQQPIWIILNLILATAVLKIDIFKLIRKRKTK